MVHEIIYVTGGSGTVVAAAMTAHQTEADAHPTSSITDLTATLAGFIEDPIDAGEIGV